MSSSNNIIFILKKIMTFHFSDIGYYVVLRLSTTSSKAPLSASIHCNLKVGGKGERPLVPRNETWWSTQDIKVH